MPSYPPRNETIKKEEELTKRREELIAAIRKNYPAIKLASSVEKYRKAELSLLKARTHLIKEKEFQNKPHSFNAEKIENQIQLFVSKTNEEILAEFMNKKYKK